MPLPQFCVTNKSIQHLVRVTNGSSASLSLWQCRTVPRKHLGWERITSVTLLAYSPSAPYWCSLCLERLSKNARNGELQGIGNLSFLLERVFQQGDAIGDVTLGQREPSLHTWSNCCVLQSLPTLAFFPASYPRKHNNPKHTVCQISGVGIRLPDPSNSWQRSAGCVGGWKINLLARKNTAGLFSTAHPCVVNRGCWNRVAGKNIQTHMYELSVSVLPPNTNRDEAVTAKASGLRAVWHCSSSQPPDGPV